MLIRYNMPQGPAITPQQYSMDALDRPLSLWNTMGIAGAETWNQTYLGTAGRENSLPSLATETTGYGSAGKGAYPIQRYLNPTEVQAQGDTLYQNEGQYKASPYFRTEIPYEKGMTASRAQALAQAHDLSAVRQYYADKHPIAAFAGGVLGAGLAPENWVPFVGELGAAATTARMGLAARIALRAGRGAADAAINTGYFQALTAHQRAMMGDDVSGTAMLQNMAFAALAGAAFGGGGALYTHLRGRDVLPRVEPPVPRETLPADIGRPPPDLTMGGDVNARFAHPGEAPGAFIEPQVHPLDAMLRNLETPMARAEAAHVLGDAAMSLADTGEVKLGEGSQATIADMAGKAEDTQHLNDPEVLKVARQAEPELFGRYDQSVAVREDARQRMRNIEANDRTGQTAADLEQERAIVQDQYDSMAAAHGRKFKASPEAQSLKNYIAELNTKIDAATARRSVGGQTPLLPEHQQARADYESADHALRDMAPKISEAIRNAAKVTPKAVPLRTSHNFTAPPADPLPQGYDNARVRVTEGVTIPKDAKAEIARLEASAKAEGLDAQTGQHDLESDMQILEATDRLLPEDKAALKAADATYQAATAWGEALDSVLRCKI